MGIVFDIKRFAVHDGPGIRTTVFFKGCPLRCRWCHNPESWDSAPEPALRTSVCVRCGRCVEACQHGAIAPPTPEAAPRTDPGRCVLCGECVEQCPAGAREIVGRDMSAAEVMAEIERDVLFYDESGGGATFSGGEPLAQLDFLSELLAECRRRSIHAALDTSLYAPWHDVERIADDVRLFLCDLKHIDPAAHEQLTGVSNGPILDNLRRLAGLKKPIIIRIPIIPGVNDDAENVTACGRFVAALDGVERVDVLPYNRAVSGKLPRLARAYEILEPPAPSQERIAEVVGRLEDLGLTVKVGG